MATLDVIFTLTIIFSLFLLLPHAPHCLQPNDQPENLVVKWICSISSNGLPVPDSSTSKVAILFPSNHALLPALEKPSNEDAVPLEMVAESEPTIDAVELPGSDSVTVDATMTSDTTISSINDQYGFHFHFPFGFHFHSHKKHGFHFDVRFPFTFHFHSLHFHYHEKEEREREKQFEPCIAGEEIPNIDDMIKARTPGFFDRKREGIMRFKEGKKKIHKKGWKKEKEDGEGMMCHKEWKKEKEKEKEGKMMKCHKKKWKKEKEDNEGMMRLEKGNMKCHKKD